MKQLDSIQAVMALTVRKEEGTRQFLTLPEGVMYNGKPLRAEVTGRSNDAALMTDWHNIVRAQYEQQESEAVEKSSKAKALRNASKQGDSDAGDGGGSTATAARTVPDVQEEPDESIEIVIERKLKAARKKYEENSRMVGQYQKLTWDAENEITQLEKLKEALV